MTDVAKGSAEQQQLESERPSTAQCCAWYLCTSLPASISEAVDLWVYSQLHQNQLKGRSGKTNASQRRDNRAPLYSTSEEPYPCTLLVQDAPSQVMSCAHTHPSPCGRTTCPAQRGTSAAVLYNAAMH
jgi:hypothetical protein